MSGNTLAHRAMRLVGFVSNVTSKMLRAAGAVFSPAEKLADGLDFALIKTGLYKTQTASHLVLSALPQCLRPQTLLGDKYDLFAVSHGFVLSFMSSCRTVQSWNIYHCVDLQSLGWVAFPLGCLCAAWSGMIVCLCIAEQLTVNLAAYQLLFGAGVCLFTAFACVFLFPMAGILALPAISITIAGNYVPALLPSSAVIPKHMFLLSSKWPYAAHAF